MKKPVSRVTDALEAIAQPIRRTARGIEHSIEHGARVDGRASRWTEHRIARREQLIDAAVQAVREFGSEAGMDQIAAAAHTSKPVIYRYFADKNDLYRAVGERVIAQLVSALRNVPLDADPQGLLRASIDAYLHLLEENPKLFRFITQSRLLNGTRVGEPTAAEFSRPVVEVLTAALGEQLRSIGLDPAGARPWGEAAVGFIRAASLWWLDNPEAMTRAQLREYLAALLWGGGAGVFQMAGRDVDARPQPGVFGTLVR
ncbi:MAG TPA: TetR/AcrR family transcriptional regulator [Jatrophihabitans sp.]|nr:TetR/AcrR family transcriptional regulator [Jatrophihabitans sp.]